jgi:hypothetical protein
MATDEQNVAELRAKAAKRERPAKDAWDRLQVLGTLLVPIAIAVAANHFSAQMKQAELEAARITAAAQRQIEETRGDRDYAIATANARITQGGFLRTLLDDLLSTDPRKQKLAGQAVLVALPESGPALLRVLEETGSADAKRTATAALNQRRLVLIAQFFSESRATRQAAYESLVSGWSADSTIIAELIAAARDNKANVDGVYNSLVFLSHMNRDALSPHVEEIRRFSQEMEGIGPRTKARAEVLRSRLPEFRK